MNRKQRRQAAKEETARKAADAGGGAGPLSLERSFQAALRHYESGRLAEAESALAQIQRAQPDVPDVLHLLALIALRTERPGIAVGHLVNAVAATPDSAELHDLLSSALVADGRVEAATQDGTCYLTNLPQGCLVQIGYHSVAGIRELPG